MTDRQTFVIISERVHINALNAVRAAPAGYTVTIAPPKRTLDQNGYLHAILTDIARSPVEWAGKRRTLDQWKALMVSAHAVATKEPGEVIPGIEGEFVAIRESTASMTVRRAASLIEYALAFCATHGVDLRETRRRGFMSEAA